MPCSSSFYVYFLLSLLLPTPILSFILLPLPPVTTNVQLKIAELIDYSRIDPSAPCCDTPRKLMISIFTPAVCPQGTYEHVPYMPMAVATYFDQAFSSFGIPNGTFSSFLLQVCPPTPAILPKPAPLVLFSPGLGASRLIYSSVMQWIATKGFTVVSIDHPYDAEIVEFPDGTIITGGNNISGSQLSILLATRVQDVSFVLTQLTSGYSPLTNQQPHAQFYPAGSKAAIFGHSFGGATAANAILSDERFTGGLNMDGAVFPPALNTSTSRPFVLLAAQGHNQTDDFTWAAAWRQWKGWKRQLEVEDTTHSSYSDLPVLAQMLGIDPAKVPRVGEAIGTIGGLKLFDIISAYVGGFLGFVLRGEGEGVLKGPSKEFPEVSFRNSSKGNGGGG